MSIRLIAKELYRLEKDVEQLEKALHESPAERKPVLELSLWKARAERDRMRGVLEGTKDEPPYRKPL